MNSIRVTVLGSGTCVPSLKRSACSILLETEHTKHIFDSGPGTMRRLLHTGVSIFDIDTIFYSHFHPDHTAELVPFIFATKYPDGAQRTKPLTIAGGNGFKDFFDGLKSVYGEWLTLPEGMLTLHEFSDAGPDRMSMTTLTVETLPMNHRPESVGYKIVNLDGKSVVYSGDTDVSDNLTSLAKGADLLICESSMPDGMKVPGHLTPSLAGEIAANANVKLLVLTHLYPECDLVDISAQCRTTYKGPLIIAEDLLTINP